ncbi:MAG: hypothetical protein AAFV29_25315 [Myxococcota bacterium]
MRIFYIRDKAGPWLVEKFEALCAIRERSSDEELMYEAVKGELQSRLAAVQVGPDVTAQLEALENGEIA